jgi:glycosyltransferase involved in cell wall biosynthesis
LVLVTTNYPYTFTGGEVMFVAPEIARLAEALPAISVAPQHAQGEELPIPHGVKLERGLAGALRRARWTRYLEACIWPGFWPELWRASRHGGVIGFVRVWRWAAVAQVTYRWARAAFPPKEPVLFYTYWRGGSTLALARLAEERVATGVITRVHRYELYEDSFSPPFQPWHPALYERLLLTVAISRHGYDYLHAAGVPLERMTLSRLGTEAAPRLAAASSDGMLRIVSCSFVTPVKRIPLMAEAVLALAKSLPAHAIHWTHFGDGPELDLVRARMAVGRTSNLAWEFPGRVDNGAVLAHYAQQPVDVFLLLSSSEGLPVSIQEAASAGIPVVATDVGGVSELVGNDNGVLLPASPTVEEIVTAIRGCAIESAPEVRQAMRAASRRRWAEAFDARINHKRFAQKIRMHLDVLNATTK